jgi:outer membrane receptor protein involved in Fe transport
VPQVPGYHAGGTVTYSAPDILTASAQLRVVGMQFDDDRNELALGAYAVVDAYASRAIWRGVQAFAAIENIFDTEYDVARTPLRTIGWPRTIRAGVKVFMPR